MAIQVGNSGTVDVGEGEAERDGLGVGVGCEVGLVVGVAVGLDDAGGDVGLVV
jgi:hypothetical protein